MSRIPTRRRRRGDQRDDERGGAQRDRFGRSEGHLERPSGRVVDGSFCGSSERSPSPSDAELSSPEPNACHDRRIAEEEEDEGCGEEEISENGQEVSEVKLSSVPEPPVNSIFVHRNTFTWGWGG